MPPLGNWLLYTSISFVLSLMFWFNASLIASAAALLLWYTACIDYITRCHPCWIVLRFAEGHKDTCNDFGCRLFSTVTNDWECLWQTKTVDIDTLASLVQSESADESGMLWFIVNERVSRFKFITVHLCGCSTKKPMLDWVCEKPVSPL